MERGAPLREQVPDFKRCERHQQAFTCSESFITSSGQAFQPTLQGPTNGSRSGSGARALEGCTQCHTRRVSDRKRCPTTPSCGSRHCRTARPRCACAHRKETTFQVPLACTDASEARATGERARARSILALAPTPRSHLVYSWR